MARMESTEYAARDGLGLAQLIAEREVTAEEVVQAAQTRAREVNPRINAIVTRPSPTPRQCLQVASSTRSAKLPAA
jgi:amidase